MYKVYYFVEEGGNVVYSQVIDVAPNTYVPYIRVPSAYLVDKDLIGWMIVGTETYWDYATMKMPSSDLYLVAQIVPIVGIKLHYDSETNQLISIDQGDYIIVSGTQDTMYLSFFFTGVNAVNVFDYECRILIERGDGQTTNDLYASPIKVDDLNAHYRMKIGGWIAEVAGTMKITAKLKLADAVDVFGMAVLNIEQGVVPNPSTVTQAQYDAIISHIQTLYMYGGSGVAIGTEEPEDEYVNFWIKIETE